MTSRPAVGFSDQSQMTIDSLHERDFYAWTQEQARLLRERRFAELDLANLVDEVESVGGSEKREIRSRLAVLIAHLLKWRFQPGARTESWRRTIREQREQLLQIVADSPSLRPYLPKVLSLSYMAGRRQAAEETGIDFTLFPEECPFTIEVLMDGSFLPKEPDLYDQS